jgi:hypothetical protein
MGHVDEISCQISDEGLRLLEGKKRCQSEESRSVDENLATVLTDNLGYNERLKVIPAAAETLTGTAKYFADAEAIDDRRTPRIL